MLHFRAVHASVYGGAVGAVIPPTWKQISSSCGDCRVSASSAHRVSPGEGVTGTGQCVQTAGGPYERLVGIEFLGSSNLSMPPTETTSGSRATRPADAPAATATMASTDGERCGEKMNWTVAYFFTLLIASFDGKQTSIHAVRCVFRGGSGEDGDAHRHNNNNNTQKQHSVLSDGDTLDDVPDLLLQDLWERLGGHMSCGRCDDDATPSGVASPDSSCATDEASTFLILSRTPLLVQAGMIDIVQASLTTSLMDEEDALSLLHGATSSPALQPTKELSDVASRVAFLSFTERLDAHTAMMAMPESRQQGRRSFTSLRCFLLRLQKEEADGFPITTKLHSPSEATGDSVVRAASLSPSPSATPALAMDSLDVAPHRYFVWLHVIGTDIYHEATVTERIEVPLAACTRGVRGSSAPQSYTLSAPLRCGKGSNITPMAHSAGMRATMGDEEGAPSFCSFQDVKTTPASFNTPAEDTTRCKGTSEVTVARLPANVLCQMGYFLRRKGGVDTPQEGKGTVTFYWLSACDSSPHGLQVREVSYVMGDDMPLGLTALGSCKVKTGLQQQHERRKGTLACVGKLVVRSAAQWSLARYPQWHHWDSVTQRLSFWAAFHTYDKLRIVAFAGHPDQRCCEFERNMPRRRWRLPPVGHHPSLQDPAFSTAWTEPFVTERGFGVTGGGDGGRCSSTMLCEPWGAACSSVASCLHMCLVPVEYEDHTRDYMLCEQLFLQASSETVAGLSASTTRLEVGLLRADASGSTSVEERPLPQEQPQRVLRNEGNIPSVCEASATTPPQSRMEAIASLGPPAILCSITALRNFVDAVQLAIPLTLEERCRVTYNTRVSFLHMNGMIAIYVPGVFVHYVDVHHKDAPPRYLFAVRLCHPEPAVETPSLISVATVAEASLRETPKAGIVERGAKYSTPLVSVLPVPFGHWLYVPGTVLLFEALLHPASVWRFIQQWLARRQTYRIGACRVVSSLPSCIPASVVTPPRVGGVQGGTVGGSPAAESLASELTRLHRMRSCQENSTTPLQRGVSKTHDCLSPHPSVFAAALEPAPLYHALHVVLTHLRPGLCSNGGDDNHAINTPAFLPSSLSSSPLASPHSSREQNQCSKSPLYLSNCHRTSISTGTSCRMHSASFASSCLEWERIWAARNLQLEEIFRTFLTVDTWFDLSVEFLSALVLGEAYERTRSACSWRPMPKPKLPTGVDGKYHVDTNAPSAVAASCNPYFVCLPLWDVAGLASEEAHYRREVSSFYRAWRNRQQEQFNEDDMRREGSIDAVWRCNACSMDFDSRLTLGSLQSSTIEAAMLPQTQHHLAPLLTTEGLGDSTLPPQGSQHSAGVRMPKYRRDTHFSGFSAASASHALRHSRSERKATLLASLLVHAVTIRDPALARQQCHNTVSEWWLCRGVSLHPTTSPLATRAAPHTGLVFTSSHTHGGTKSSSLLYRIKDVFLNHHQPSHHNDEGTSSTVATTLSSIAPSTPVARIVLSPAHIAGYSNITLGAEATSEGHNRGMRTNNPLNTSISSGSTTTTSAVTKNSSTVASTTKNVTSAATTGAFGTRTRGGKQSGVNNNAQQQSGSLYSDKGTRKPFDGASCGASFGEAVLEQLHLVVWPSVAGQSVRLPSSVVSPFATGSGTRKEKWKPKTRGLSWRSGSDMWVRSRFLTPATASSFASGLITCATSTAGIAAQLALLALLYDAAIASVIHALVHAINTTAVDSFSCEGNHQSDDAGVGEGADDAIQARWGLLQRLSSALERLGVPPSVALSETLAREGLRHLPTRVFLAGQCSGAIDTIDLPLLLRHQPAMAANVRDQVLAFAAHQSHELGLTFSPTTADSPQKTLTREGEQLMVEVISRALHCEAAVFPSHHEGASGGAAAEAMERTPASRTWSGYSDITSPVLALKDSYHPRCQERMLQSQLVMNAVATIASQPPPPPQQRQRLMSVGDDDATAQNLTFLLREQKCHVIAALDPGPYLQLAGEHNIPAETEFASPFSPFQWWWQRKRNQQLSMHMSVPSPQVVEQQKQQSCHPHHSATPTPSPDFSDGKKVCEFLGTPLSPMLSQTMMPSLDGMNAAASSASNMEIGEGGEGEGAEAVIPEWLIPQLLVMTPLGRTVTKERAKVAMAVALDPFFRSE